MRRYLGSGTLIGICATLAVLLAALAVVQYRWSARVAAADAQREREHLDSAATLFADQFNSLTLKTISFIQNDARTAFQANQPLQDVPKFVGELYHLTILKDGTVEARRLAANGLFESVAVPAWLPAHQCNQVMIAEPPALVSPTYEFAAVTARVGDKLRVMSTIASGPSKCFVARLDTDYLRGNLFPQLVRQSFGETGMREYEFAVIARDQTVWSSGNRNAIHPGGQIIPDLRKSFFSVRPILHPPKDALRAPGTQPPKAIFVQRFETTVVSKGEIPVTDLLGEGIWELQVAHKGVPLAAAYERIREWNLLFSLGVELLLAVAIVFLVISVRRTQVLAEQKMQFVASVTHELRTPVSAISMLARNQADGLVTGSDRVQQYGELIHQESRRLNDMVEQTLQYAGAHSGLRRRADRPLDLAGLIRDVVAARREDLARRGFEIEMAIAPELPPVSGDSNLLRTAIDNLLSNAEKYSNGSRWIRVRAVYAESEKEIRISVEDRGTGIDVEDQDEIFEPFSRGRAAVEAQIPGTGLGLSLVRSAAEAHHGTVTLESAPGRGSTFTLHLPV